MDELSVSEKVGGDVELPMPTHCAVDLLVVACRRCGGPMKPGLAMGQTFRGGSPDFIGGQVVTMSAGGPGKLIKCLKCAACGHSVTPNVAGNRLARQGQSELTGVLGARNEKRGNDGKPTTDE